MTLIESKNLKTHSQPSLISKPHPNAYLTCLKSLDTSLAVTCQSNVLLLDRSNLKPRAAVPHANRVSKLEKCINHNNMIASADLDGNLWVWDERYDGDKGINVQVQSSNGKKSPIHALSLNTDVNTVVAGTELVGDDASIVIYDIRNTKSPIRRYDELHSDDITTLKILPNNHLLTGSSDGLLMYVDPNIADDNDASLGCVNVGSSIADVGYTSNGHIWTYTDMQTAAIYTLDEENQLELHKDLGDIRSHSLDNRWETDYIIQMSEIEQELVCFGGKSSGEFSMISNLYSDFNLERVMKGGHTEVVRSIEWDDKLNAVVSVGEDAKVSVWNANDATSGFRLERGRDDDDDGMDFEQSSKKVKS